MKKVELIIVLECGKSVQIFITLKKRLVWVFYIRGERDNETGGLIQGRVY